MHWTGGLAVCGHNLNSHRSLITLSPHTQDNDLLLYKYKYMFTIQILKLQSKNTNSKGANAKWHNANIITKPKQNIRQWITDNLLATQCCSSNTDICTKYKYQNNTEKIQIKGYKYEISKCKNNHKTKEIYFYIHKTRDHWEPSPNTLNPTTSSVITNIQI